MANRYTNVMRYARVLLCEKREHYEQVVSCTDFIHRIATTVYGKQSIEPELLVISYCYNNSVWADDGAYEYDLNFEAVDDYKTNIEQAIKSIDRRSWIRIQDLDFKLDGLSPLIWRARHDNLVYHCHGDIGLMIIVAAIIGYQTNCALIDYQHERSRYTKRRYNYMKRVYRKLINRICVLAKQEQQ